MKTVYAYVKMVHDTVVKLFLLLTYYDAQLSFLFQKLQ